MLLENEIAAAQARAGEAAAIEQAAIAADAAARDAAAVAAAALVSAATLVDQAGSGLVEAERIGRETADQLGAALADVDVAQGAVTQQEILIEERFSTPPEHDVDESPTVWRPVLAQWQAGRIAATRELTRRRQQLDQATAAVPGLRARRDQLDQAVAAARAARDAATAALAARRTDSETAAAALVTATSTLAAAADERTAATGREAGLRARVAEIERDPFDRAALERVAAELGSELEALRADLDVLLKRRADLEAEDLGLARQRAAADAVLAVAVADRDASSTEAATKAVSQSDAAATLAAARSRLDAAGARLSQVKQRQLRRPGEVGRPDPLLLAEWRADVAEAAAEQVAALQALTAASDADHVAAIAAAEAGARATALAAVASELTAARDAVVTSRAANAGDRADTAATADALVPRVAELAAARESATARLLGDVPLTRPGVLLPVRIETAYADAPRGDGGIDLIVRLFPVDVHVDSFEPELTDAERTAGAVFHAATAAAADEPARQSAWAGIADLFGPQRAAWIARATDPTTPDPRGAGTRAAAWTRAPRAGLLPERFVVIGRAAGGRTVVTAWGEPLPTDGPVVGPDPAATAGGTVPEWMRNPDAAARVGMALRVPLTAEQATAGIDRLVLVGLSAGGGDERDAERLAAALEAHHYTSGVALVAPGTPSNNTAEQPSGYRRRDPDGTRGLRTERGAPLISAEDGSDGALLASALGVPAATLAHVVGADDRNRETAGLVREALGATPGGALAAVTAGADAVGAWLHPEGPLPMLRVGSQPLGVLPAGCVRRWIPNAGDPAAHEESALCTLLQHRAVPGAAPARAVDDLDGVLEQTPASTAWNDPAGVVAVRLDPAEMAALAGPVEGIAEDRRPAGQDVPRSLLYMLLRAQRLADPSVDNRSADRLAVLAARPLATVVARAAELLDAASHRDDVWATALATRRLAQMREKSPAVVLGAFGWVDDVPLAPADRGSLGTLGYLLAPSPAHAATAAVLRSGWAPHRAEVGSALAVDLSSARVRLVRWILDGVRAGQPPGALLGYRLERDLADSGLGALIAPLRTVAGLRGDDAVSTAQTAVQTARDIAETARGDDASAGLMLDRATEAVDAAAAALTARTAEREGARSELNGIDAAIADADAAADATSAESRQIAEQLRVDEPSIPPVPKIEPENRDVIVVPDSIWVDGIFLTRAEAWNRIAELGAMTRTERDRAARLRHQDRPPVQARHDTAKTAVTAAEKTLAEATGRQALLVSPRARAAETLGAAEDKLATALRRLAAAADAQWSRVAESVPAHDVVDGLALHRRVLDARATDPPRWDSTTIPFGQVGTGLPAVSDPGQVALMDCLGLLADTIDALGDALLAESVHHLVGGQPDRVGATLEALEAGAPPPPLDVARSPRGGTGSILRVVLLVDPDPTPRWSAAGSVRTVAEPRLDAWLSRMLPDPAGIRVPVTLRAVEGTDPVPGVPASVVVELGELGLGPLDVLVAVQDDRSGGAGEVTLRVARAALVAAGRPAGVVALPDPYHSADEGGPTLAELVAVATTAAELVARSRPLDLRDLDLPGADATGMDLGELAARATAVVDAATRAADGLDAAVAGQGPLDAALLRAAACGLPAAVPDAAESAAELAERAAVVGAEIRRRIARAVAEPDSSLAAIRHILGERQPILPCWTPADPAPLTTLLAGAPGRLGETRPGLTTWLTDAAEVRAAVAALSEAFGTADALGGGEQLALRVGQLPHAEPDRWVGLPAAEGTAPVPGRVGVVLQGTHQPGAAVCGLLVDEWAETVPAAAETAAITFHTPTPNARAPKTILLAVPPDPAPAARPPHWDLDSLVAILEETMERARTRVAPPEAAGLDWGSTGISDLLATGGVA